MFTGHESLLIIFIFEVHQSNLTKVLTKHQHNPSSFKSQVLDLQRSLLSIYFILSNMRKLFVVMLSQYLFINMVVKLTLMI